MELVLTNEMLLGELPYHQCSTDMDIEGPHQPKLRDLHTLLQVMDKINWYAFSFIPQQKQSLPGEIVACQAFAVSSLLHPHKGITLLFGS
jgi:hypothetical protein